MKVSNFWNWKEKNDLKKIRNLQLEILGNIDVLVDGPYIEKLRDVCHCPFRGSTNQRIIEMKKS